MPAAAKDETFPPLGSGKEIFFLAAGVGAALETHQGANAARGEKPHQGIFSKNRGLRVRATWAKWSGTHQDRSRSWLKTLLGSALDANGNTLSDPSGKSYSWDFENRLTQVVNPGVGTTTFKYDPFGRRIQKSGPLGTMNYVYDSADIVEELDSVGGALARYTRTQNIDEPLAEFRSGATSYYLTDGLRSVTSLTDTSATVAATYGYDAFGNLSNSTGSIGNSFRYTGREFDPESGLHYYRTRYYDSAVGRFTSEDLIRFKGGTNFYPYVNNRPVTFTDPIGTCLLQLVTSPNAHAEACGLEPKTNDRCACLCAISPNFEGCMKDCKDGCLSSRLNPVEVCQCLCNKGKENGTLNWFEAMLCKQGCKRNLK